MQTISPLLLLTLVDIFYHNIERIPSIIKLKGFITTATKHSFKGLGTKANHLEPPSEISLQYLSKYRLALIIIFFNKFNYDNLFPQLLVHPV